MKNLNPYIIATKLGKIIFNLKPYEGIKIRLLKNFTLTICKIKNVRGSFFTIIGEITYPCDKEYSEKVIEFDTYDIYFSRNSENISFISYYRTDSTNIKYDLNFIKIEDFSICEESRAEMVDLISRFNSMTDSYRC